MADKPLSPFQIRNLGPSSQPTAGEGALIQISGPAYDRTISDNPAATLRYQDEDNDTIIVCCTGHLISHPFTLMPIIAWILGRAGRQAERAYTSTLGKKFEEE